MFSKKHVIKSRKFPATGEMAALLIHGGCFTEGDETWNNDQAQAISSNCTITIFTIDFSKESFDDSKKNIGDYYKKLYQEYNGKVGIIACSSGGFLALSLLNVIVCPLFVALICPVMNPEKREDLLLAMDSPQYAKIHAQQLHYFRKRPYPTASISEQTFTIVAARNDENVPLALIEDESKRYPNAHLYLIDGTHAVSYEPCDAVTDIIRKLIHDIGHHEKASPLYKMQQQQ